MYVLGLGFGLGLGLRLRRGFGYAMGIVPIAWLVSTRMQRLDRRQAAAVKGYAMGVWVRIRICEGCCLMVRVRVKVKLRVRVRVWLTSTRMQRLGRTAALRRYVMGVRVRVRVCVRVKVRVCDGRIGKG